jgi:predicted permease
MHERRSIDPGFDLARVLTFTIEPGLQGLNGERKGAFYTALTARLRELPAVSGASLAWIRPYAMILDDADVRAGDAPDGAAVNAERNWVGSGYFATMGIGLIDGREFTGSELHRSENVPPHTVIINEPLARRLFGISHAAGRSIVLARGVRAEVVGVVKGTRSRRLNEPPPLQMYSPFGRRDWASIVVRVDAPVAAVLPQIREAVRGLDKSLPIYDVMTLGDTVERHLSEDALVTRLTGTFAILATLLASIGLYGVLSQAVAERRPEFGIRAALGAAPGHVLTMVLSDALRVTLVGSALGAILAFWLVRFIEGRLFGIRPFDPWSYGAAVTGVLAVALLAAFLPARRAAGVDPVIALRE